ncbi:hypothetical protein QJS83_04670 [Bdellovibrio sp. 22V]|uniref:hypothetical protein n=1 Tax=Bdellovibrio TaxID=958 RepID=UPI002543010F|nr:hypothetical protein [Bdellovibrio sp. 22V]WII73165.1 hypothetical protein QJS83_04670 [Bdellovibrio sp. 22V]
MGFNDRKLETAILGLAILLVGGLGYVLKTPVQAVLSEAEVVYEMPRPKKSFLASLFDLGDREVSRKYVNPFAKKEAAKTADAKKNDKAAPAKPVAQKKQDTKKTAEARKPKVDVQVVGGNDTKTLGGDEIFPEGQRYNQNYSDTANNSNPAQAKEDKNVMGGDQWRALLMAQPTKENVAKLMAAFSNNEIDEQMYYTIVTDLFRNNKSEVQALGLVAVKGAYNVKSFSITAQYYDQLTPEVQTQAHAYLLTYAVSGRLPILASALQSSNAEVVMTAVEVVKHGHQQAKDGVNPGSDPRNSRGDVVVNGVAGYAKFIPIFQQLSQSQDATIAGLASSALSQIQTTAVAAL